MGGNSDLDQALHRSVLKRRAPLEAKIAEEDRKAKEALQTESVLFGAAELTKDKIRQILDSNRRMYYRTEELNDKLFLHFGGFTKLENLEKFTGLKTLYAESNALETMRGLEAMPKMRSLFLQQNCIRKMENLHYHPELWSLNLSENFIDKIECLSDVPGLNTLNLTGNRIGFRGLDDVIDLANSSVSCLDLQNNKIDDIDFLPEVLMQMRQLRVLYLKGNPFVKRLPNYRKTLIAHLPNLSYLDDRPVFKEEHRWAQAFNRGGIEEEREERKTIKQEERDAQQRNMDYFRRMIKQARKEKEERSAMRTQDKFTDSTDPVESPDARMDRLQKEWETKNASELQDDAKAYAKKCLEAETRRLEGEYPHTNAPVQQARSAPVAAAHSDASEKGTEEKEEGVIATKQDTRSLRYDDIWDDEPVVFKKPSSKSADDAVYSAAFLRSRSADDVAVDPALPQSHSSTDDTVDRLENIKNLEPRRSCLSTSSKTDGLSTKPKKKVGWCLEGEETVSMHSTSTAETIAATHLCITSDTASQQDVAETAVERPPERDGSMPSTDAKDSSARDDDAIHRPPNSWYLAIKEDDGADQEVAVIQVGTELNKAAHIRGADKQRCSEPPQKFAGSCTTDNELDEMD
eukprot:GEMP01015653.1.p1 GENE.GEMP01015653.1~~GEMP01015653.1.p1  ORF type:complete len:632 (+),score=135.16 GEMP01015653.1:71-1966(+)